MYSAASLARKAAAGAAVLTAVFLTACKKDSVTSPAQPVAVAPSNDSNDQVGIAGLPLGRPVIVFVTDANGNGVPRTNVTWTVSNGDGLVSATTDTSFTTTTTTPTDDYGYASANWELGMTPGTDSLTAATSDGGQTIISATAQAATAASLSRQLRK